jgi:hypothetical protein
MNKLSYLPRKERAGTRFPLARSPFLKTRTTILDVCFCSHPGTNVTSPSGTPEPFIPRRITLHLVADLCPRHLVLLETAPSQPRPTTKWTFSHVGPEWFVQQRRSALWGMSASGAPFNSDHIHAVAISHGASLKSSVSRVPQDLLWVLPESSRAWDHLPVCTLILSISLVNVYLGMSFRASERGSASPKRLRPGFPSPNQR